MVQEERIKRLTSEKEAIEANLRLLQAQIEPHFLFNTLSNILSLLDSDSEKGKSMLTSLTRYLRKSLSKVREYTSTVGQEMELIEDYLKIFKVRMGGRLLFKLDVSDSVRDLPLPPMLIQPLVENAIKHGLEPKVQGGEILIRGKENDSLLRLEIIDTGMGFNPGRKDGLGLANIRERLQALYGNDGRLVIEENQPGGVKAIIEVPYGKG
jgi:LytS/YehU family sensor histidine kinase